MRVAVPERVRPITDWVARVGRQFTGYRMSLVAGGLAYFVALSLAPLAIAFGTLAGLVLSPEEVKSALESLADNTPDAAHLTANTALKELLALVTGASAAAASITTIVSLAVALYASSKVVYGVRMAMNTAFAVPDRRGGMLERLVSALVTLVGLIIGVVVIVAVTIIPKILHDLGIDSSGITTGQAWLDWAIVTVLVYAGVWAVLSFAPSRRRLLSWRDWGVLVGTVAVMGATAFVGVYVHYSSTMSAAILALGTPVVLLLWLYLCFIGILSGALVSADARALRDQVPIPGPPPHA